MNHVTDSLLGEAGRRVREAVRDELVPWALGHADPALSAPRPGSKVKIAAPDGTAVSNPLTGSSFKG